MPQTRDDKGQYSSDGGGGSDPASLDAMDESVGVATMLEVSGGLTSSQMNRVLGENHEPGDIRSQVKTLQKHGLATKDEGGRVKLTEKGRQALSDWGQKFDPGSEAGYKDIASDLASQQLPVHPRYKS